MVALIGYSIHGYPALGASGQALAEWAAKTDPNRFALGVYIEAVGILLILVFYAWLCDLIRRNDTLAWLAMFAFAMVVVWGAAGILSNSAWTALLDAGRRGADASLLASTRDVAQEIFNSTYVFFGLGMVAIALASLSGRVLPLWLSWTGLIIGVGLAIPATVNFAGLFVILWAFAIAILYLVGHPNKTLG